MSYFQYTPLKLKMQSHMTVNSVHLSKTAVIYDYVIHADDTATSRYVYDARSSSSARAIDIQLFRGRTAKILIYNDVIIERSAEVKCRV